MFGVVVSSTGPLYDCHIETTNNIQLRCAYLPKHIYQAIYRFCLACMNGRTETVEMLIERSDCGIRLETGLFLACQHGHADTARALIRSGAKNTWGPCMNEAAGRGHTKVVELLLEHKYNNPCKCRRHDDAIRAAAEYNHASIVGMLLGDSDYKADVPFMIAARSGFVKTLLVAIEFKADIRANDDYALRVAAENGHDAVVEILLGHGANPQARENEALRHAIENNRFGMVRLLIQHGASIAGIDRWWVTTEMKELLNELQSLSIPCAFCCQQAS